MQVVLCCGGFCNSVYISKKLHVRQFLFYTLISKCYPPFFCVHLVYIFSISFFSGGNGYINDYPTGRLLRDAKLYEIGAGTSEVRRLVIGRALNFEYK